MKTVKLITCDDAFQAHVIQGALKNEGIASVLHNENMSSVMRGYVRDMYAASAALILRSRWRKEQLKNNQVFILLTAFQSSPGFYVPIGFPQNPGKPMCLLYGLG